MQLIKGFVSINEYINNIKDATALLGEINTSSLTYSTEKGEYYDVTLPGYNFICFKSIDSITNLHSVVNQVQVSQIIDIVQSCENYALTQIRPMDEGDFLDFITSEYAADISSLQFGSLIDNGTTELPEWISWTDILSSNEIKIWLSDISFSEQYDEYEIYVIPPIENIDDFFNTYTNVLTAVEAETMPETMVRIELQKNNKPYTYLKPLEFEFVNPLDESQTIKTLWWFLIYGKAGDNIDNIKNALTNFILDNSVNDEEDWEGIFPELFKRTEFVILPRWDKIAIDNLSSLSSIYSSILDPNECIDFAKTVIPFYEDIFIHQNINIIPYDYKALSMLVVNGPNNSVDKQDFREVFPDYIPISSTSLDFNRMQILTRDFVLLLGSLIMAAEVATVNSITPAGFSKVTREGILFISVIYENMNFLMAARSNLFYQN